MKIRAPAKINLSLRVVGRREDGYHLLDTLMVPITLYDELAISGTRLRRTGRETLRVTCDHPLVPSGEENLAYRAAALLLARKGIRARVRVHIRKRIPVGGGLGGGSSDAAATLLGLNRLFRLGCERRELLTLAASLGADVPFFIYGRPARARGVGEQIRPLAVFPTIWLVVLYPGFPVSTAWVYRQLRKHTLTKPIGNTSIRLSLRDPERIGQLLVNDLEKVAMRRYPEIAVLKERLTGAGAAGGLMSGSGSCVFGIFPSERVAREAFRRLRKEGGKDQAYLVRSLN
jgi:4-diphosphocytidyl-2-C-methyl-D-erythritol kinase